MYRSLDVPVEGPSRRNMPPVVSREEARTILFGKSKAKVTKLPDETDLPEQDDDTLFYADIQPDHNAQGLTADGRHKSDAELREQQEEEFIHEYQEAREEHKESNAMDIDPAPPYTPAEPATVESFGTSALQVSLSEASNSGGTPQQVLTPVSAVTSIQSSEGASAVSSGSAMSSPFEGNRAHRKSVTAAQRSRKWKESHRQPPARNRYSPP